MATVVAKGIEKRFPAPGGAFVHALASVDMTVGDGEFVCLLGPSGCGKSTLLNIMGGLLRADAGTVSISATGRTEPIVRTVFQEARLLPWMTVRENLGFVLDGPTRDKDERVLDWLDRIGLGGTHDFYPRQLSIGMQQRLAVARGLIIEPDVLFMDEPFGSLDELTAGRMREELLHLWGDLGCTVVFVTHNPLEATFLADRILIMSASPGRITSDYQVSELIPRPRDSDDPRLWEASRVAVRSLKGES